MQFHGCHQEREHRAVKADGTVDAIVQRERKQHGHAQSTLMHVPRGEARDPTRNVRAKNGVLVREVSPQRGLLVGQYKKMGYEPTKESVDEDTDISEEKRLAENQRNDCYIHWVADEAIRPADNEMPGWKNGCGCANALERESQKRLYQNDEASSHQKDADHTNRDETEERWMNAPPADQPGNETVKCSGSDEEKERGSEDGQSTRFAINGFHH
jgi:hypothetical protein